MTLFSALAGALKSTLFGPLFKFCFSKPATWSILQWVYQINFALVLTDFIMSLLFRLISKYSPAVMLPISAVVGFIGYKIENWISDKYTPTLKSVKEKREERLLNEEKEVESLKEHQFVPKTIFEKNLSPSLKEPDPRLKKYSEMRL